MNEPERLAMLLFDPEAAPGRLGIRFQPFGPDQLIEVAYGLDRVHCASRLA